MIANYLYKNILWKLRQNPFETLLCPATTTDDYLEQLEKIANGYFPKERRIDTLTTEFCLNKIALLKADTEAEQAALEHFGAIWQQFVRLKKIFNKKYLTFAADDNGVRAEQIAELWGKCSQFAADKTLSENMLAQTRELLQLTERENRYLADIVELERIKYYCAATLSLFANKKYAEICLARMLRPNLLKCEYQPNKRYRQVAYAGSSIASVIDCMGNSATRFGTIPTRVETKLFVYSNGRNVFDTFCNSKMGERTAKFLSVTPTVEVEMHYFLAGNREIRAVTLRNKGKRARKFCVEIPFACNAAKSEYFKMGDALCLSGDVFAALSVVHNSAAIACRGETSRAFDITVESGARFDFEIVTTFAEDTPTLADALTKSEKMGETNCPYLWDKICSRVRTTDTALRLFPHGYTKSDPQRIRSSQLNFSYRMGNDDVATFVDNVGNSTTLLDGFVFGVGGESVYSVYAGLATKLNADKFVLDGDRLQYQKSSICNVRHSKGKLYTITHPVAKRTLFYFPLEKKSKIGFDAKMNVFEVEDEMRRYYVYCVGKIESYTADALECSEEKLRYKLSNNLQEGNCLAICFAPDVQVKLEIVSAKFTPQQTPIVRESLVSTYLNYVNGKNVFCLRNRLKRPDALSLAAICYTNPQFVKNYLDNNLQNNANDGFYYDSAGDKKAFCDKLAVPLATVYYLSLIGDLSEDLIKQTHEALFCQDFDGKDLCIKALALQKAAKLDCFDKVRCLVEYSKLKKQICASKLYAYAQAIGAVPLTNPSKERLKDLCNKYDIPKSWYYVSQLENLYGLSICSGKLQISPTVTAENVLEQFALNIAGKRIDTTFAKASVRCMTLNGQQCFQPFFAPSLTNEQNSLVVHY